MKDTNIEISSEELLTLHDKDFFYRKYLITEKIISLFSTLEVNLHNVVLNKNISVPQKALMNPGKISKGENYKQLPYIVLDYPRLFLRQNVFAYRSLFWWGNYFSFTLHLQGKVLDHYRKTVSKNLALLQDKGCFISIGKSPWEHDLGPENYIPANEFLDKQNKIQKYTPFIKFVRKLELHEWNKVVPFGEESFRLYLELLSPAMNQ